jgi:predicted dehydrogenase
MLRVAIVGCGKIADQHVAALRRIPDCRVVALCDRELLMARQLGERIGLEQCYADLTELLQSTSPDVVHITTPPQSHFLLAQQCLEAGRHVYLEKPFTVTAKETETLLKLAEARRRQITAGHNYQFTLEMLEMRRLVQNGFLGGKPVHIESYFSYGLNDASYVVPILGSRNHWVRQLPGQLFHNLLSHGIAPLAEFLDDDIPELFASAHQSDRLRELGGEEMLDELRVLLRDAAGTTAFFCFSTQLSPALNQLRICGPKSSLLVDRVSGSLIRHRPCPSKSYLTYFIPPLCRAREHFRGACRNIADFLGRRLYQDFGMKEIIQRFYDSIRHNRPPPIPHREILLTARIMDEIFAQVYPGQPSRPAQPAASPTV